MRFPLCLVLVTILSFSSQSALATAPPSGEEAPHFRGLTFGEDVTKQLPRCRCTASGFCCLEDTLHEKKIEPRTCWIDDSLKDDQVGVCFYDNIPARSASAWQEDRKLVKLVVHFYSGLYRVLGELMEAKYGTPVYSTLDAKAWEPAGLDVILHRRLGEEGALIVRSRDYAARERDRATELRKQQKRDLD